MIKVGKTTRSFGYRLREYKNREEPLKILKEFWLETELTERNLILFCRKHGRQCRGNEWFRGILFEDVVEYLIKHTKTKELKQPTKRVSNKTTCYPKIERVQLPTKILTRLQHDLIIKQQIQCLQTFYEKLKDKR